MKFPDHFLFFSPVPPTNNTIVLDQIETHHALDVLRLQKGDTIQITNGNGTIYNCSIAEISKKQLTATIRESRSLNRQLSIHLMIGLPERDSFETVITECTALGISRITPLVTSHSQKPWWKHSWDKHNERFTSKMIGSMKQSLFPFLPLLDPPLPFNKSLEQCTYPVVVADQEGNPIIPSCQNLFSTNIICYIGPPGGFSDEELNLLASINAVKVKIGEPRFRTELASVVLCSQLIAISQMRTYSSPF
jgi:16S rRNA (uracil1498-N3)-methyltransferase